MSRHVHRTLWVGVLCALSVSVGACQPSDETPDSFHNDLLGPVPSPERNLMTEAGVALGRALFYDPILSRDGTVSCATCHQQERAFSDGDQRSAAGVSQQPLLRHTPALFNLAWMPAYFWDGGASDLESQAFAPLEHVDEMDRDLKQLLADLAVHPAYPRRFERAFSDGLTLPNVVRALAQFERSLISTGAPYDRWMRGEDSADFGGEELAGYAVFQTHCSSCHGGPFLTDFSYRNNGLDGVFPEDDLRVAWGRARITEEPSDMGAFKVPSLRNVTRTAPYMHDGRFDSLDAVLAHYRFGIKDSPTLDPRLRQQDGSLGLALTDAEVLLLRHFLAALTDETFLTNPAHGPPI